MIVSKLKGGLGNQLFQYAIGRALAIKHNQKLYLDISDYQSQNHRVHRTFDLNFFNIKAITVESLEELPKNFIQLLTNKPLFLDKILEKKNQYDHNILAKHPPIYLDGYWQCYKYFDSIINKLRNEIKLTCDLSPAAKKLYEKINERVSVAVHFRRGDYVTDSIANSVHGLCSDEYYFSSIELLRETNNRLQILIFSDDIEYVKKQFSDQKDFIFVDNINSHIEEFDLMKHCNHFIISNSTFSWWAAWLSENKDKKIIAPKIWFKDKELQSQTNDLIPENWIKM